MSDSPSAGSMEFGTVHEATLTALGRHFLIVLLNRLGGKLDIPVQEVDDTAKYVLGFHATKTEITGDAVTDAKVSLMFHFEVRKKQ